MRAKQALVTGGAGFIGSHVVDRLLSEGWGLRVLDDLSSGHRGNLPEGQVDFREGSVEDRGAVDAAMSGVDVVFHLAASVGRQRSIDDPAKDSSTNVLGTVNVLESMRKEGVRRIVYSSSAAVFGELREEAVGEDHPCSPNCPYGVSKFAAELMVRSYAEMYGFVGACLRYFNIYGPRQRYDLYGNVIPIFSWRVLDGRGLTIYGDGKQTRDFLHVRDVAEANFLASEIQTGLEVLNLGSGSAITILDLAERVMSLSGERVELAFAGRRVGDVTHCRADIEMARGVLNFTPRVSLDLGLDEYWQWCRDHRRE